MKLYTKRNGTIFAISGMLALIFYLGSFSSPSQQFANALDFKVSDFKCIAVVGNIGDNICGENNSVTNDIANQNNIECSPSLTQSNSNSLASDQSNSAEQDASPTSEQSNTATFGIGGGSTSNSLATELAQSITQSNSNTQTVDQSNSAEQCTLITTPN